MAGSIATRLTRLEKEVDQVDAPRDWSLEQILRVAHGATEEEVGRPAGQPIRPGVSTLQALIRAAIPTGATR